MNPKPGRRRGQEGFVLALSGILLLTMFALMVVAIDIGRISHTATEVQVAVDAAALAGAENLLKGGNVDSAKAAARIVHAFGPFVVGRRKALSV